jgi:hypothetical protein
MYTLALSSINQTILQIDIIVALLCCIVVAHILYYTRSNGVRCLQTIILSAFFIERLSIRLGETHCHADASMMVANCSSLNSILFYVPWMYTCWASGCRIGKALNMPAMQLSLLIGILHPLFCVPYELTGANSAWWKWGKNVEALGDRLYNVPIMTVMFHFTFGLFLILSQGFIEPWCMAMKKSKVFPSSFTTFLFPTVLCCIVTQLGSVLFLTAMGLVEKLVPSISRRALSVGILVWSVAILLNWIVLFYWRQRVASKDKDIAAQAQAQSQRDRDIPELLSRPDWTLFSIPCVFLSFILYANKGHFVSLDGRVRPWDEVQPFARAVVIDVVVALIVFALCCISTHKSKHTHSKNNKQK